MRRYLLRSVFAATMAVAAGCSAPDLDRLGSMQQALFTNDKAAYDYFIGKGLTNFQAAGVVGNLDQESGIDPAIHQAGGGVGRGIAQWSAGARWDTTPNDNVVAYAAQHGQSATSLTLQFDFIWYELTTFPEYGLTQLKASTNLTDATTAFEDLFEGCVYANYPECALPSRINFAKGILNAYGADTGQSGAGGGGASTGGAGGGGVGGGGASTGGATTGGAAGTSIAGTAGMNSAVGGSGSGGGAGGASISGAAGSGTAGTVSVAGASITAGSTSVGGGVASAGATGTAGSTSFTNPSSSGSDSSCALSPAKAPSRSSATNYLVIALLAATWLFRRRAR